jgi:UDP-N-acetylmuramoyl-tripeptide--D-alanyl-D-alanine ligase
MGMNHPGEITALARIAAPDVGLVTNVLPGHLAGVGSLEGVAAAKKELLDSMATGIAILNADDPRVRAMAEGFGGQVVFFGQDPKADVRILDTRETEDGLDVEIATPKETGRVRINAHGMAMAANAAAAVAAGFVAGISMEKAAAGLTNWSPVSGRLCMSRLPNGAGLLDDTYNANPGSVAAAIATLVSLKKDGRAFLVLGDMLELGDHAAREHEMIGKLAAREGVDKIFATGGYADHVAAGAVHAGMSASLIVTGAKESLAKRLAGELGPKDWVLVKGSRGMAMEEAVSHLIKILELKKLA